MNRGIIRKTTAVAMAAGLAAVLASGAGAQAPAQDAAVVEELVVRAFGGPAWWKVSDRDTSVWIMALPTVPIPRDVTVDTAVMERRLRGANVLIVEPVGRRGMSILTRSRFDRLMRETNANTKETLEPSLPPAIRARFVAARERLGQPASRYGALPPGLAGMALAGDATAAYQKANPEVSENEALALLTDLAERQKVPVKSAWVIDGFWGFLGEARKTDLECLRSTLDYIDTELRQRTAQEKAEERRIFDAWLEGDVRPALEKSRSWTIRVPDNKAFFNASFRRPTGTLNLHVPTGACLRQLRSQQRVLDDIIPRQTEAIRKALRRKGHAVAVYEPYPLLVRGGILDRLRREGFTVTPPGGAN